MNSNISRLAAKFRRLFPRRAVAIILAAGLVSSCSPSSEEFTVSFEVRLHDTKADCSNPVGDLALTDFRMLVHDVRVGGEAMTFVTDDFWQLPEVALLDGEDGQGSCRDGTERQNMTLRLVGKPPVKSGLTFTIGVPESLNHGNPTIAAAPLSFTDMHWHWRSGYRFLRAGIRKYSGPDEDPPASTQRSVFLHLGSAGCKGTISKIEGCRQSNRPRVNIESFVPARDRVILDLDVLLAAAVAQESNSSCSSGPDETACSAMFEVLGIDPVSGESVRAAGAFRSAPIE